MIGSNTCLIDGVFDANVSFAPFSDETCEIVDTTGEAKLPG
jgi:hypothetical protein